MTSYDFILSNIGETVYITGDYDLAFSSEYRKYIFEKIPLNLIRLNKSGKAILQDSKGNLISVRPRNVRLYSELKSG